MILLKEQELKRQVFKLTRRDRVVPES